MFKKKVEEELIEIKIYVTGSSGVGKTSILCQFIQGIFVEEYDPTIEDVFRKITTLNDKKFLVDLNDSYHGGEEYQQLRDMPYRTSHGIIIVFDIISKRNFQEIKTFYDNTLRIQDTDSYPMMVIGNKVDLDTEREVSYNEAMDFCQKFNIQYFETSAKTGFRVNEAIEHFCLICYGHHFKKKEKPKNFNEKKGIFSSLSNTDDVEIKFKN